MRLLSKCNEDLQMCQQLIFCCRRKVIMSYLRKVEMSY
jgi:hypothetical protein